jgi:hypothetical protein
MINAQITRRILTAFIALVWFVNGLVCKVLNLVPRHSEIVARIVGEDHARLFTSAIGVAEMLMVVWIVSGIKSRFCAICQITVVATMNIIEFIMVPDLLLFGRMNIVVAALFIVVIYIHEFLLLKRNGYTITK